ncbi:hypothetical protein SteCoe_12715 [Stentor coeruleus]|uniref:Derlin n=1 Tax=Stentor coeruleus TaxID=5963 RepID=A0A1R2CA42_9CILI|nr:hypothetical protein SteCoe_12715 [Stentor coeruleus]
MFFTNPNQDISGKLISWWQTVPFFSRCIFYITIPLSILSYFPAYPGILLILSPAILITYFNFWSLLTFPYQHFGLLGIVFALFSFSQTGPRNERRMGTARYFIYFTINNLILGIMLVCAGIAMQEINVPALKSIIFSSCDGLWPFIMIEIVLRCNKDPEAQVQFMCFPFMIKSKYYPWMFFAFFSVLFKVMWDLLAGICVGYLHLYGLMKFTEVSDSFAEKIENTFCKFIKERTQFITVSNSGNEEPRLTPVSITTNDVINNRTQPTVFTGQGYRLGGDLPPQSRQFAKFDNVDTTP